MLPLTRVVAVEVGLCDWKNEMIYCSRKDHVRRRCGKKMRSSVSDYLLEGVPASGDTKYTLNRLVWSPKK